MRIVKPQKLGLIHRTYTLNSAHHFVVSPLIFFELSRSCNILTESDGWAKLMNGLPSGQVLDEGMPKTNAEVLLVGNAHAPDGHLVSELPVALTLGKISKTLLVSGHRLWQKRFLRFRMTPPAMFRSMPITWGNSFGHRALDANPVGVGHLQTEADGQVSIALPNIEYADDRLKRIRKSVRPASFAPVSITWRPRSDFVGTYDDAYFDQHFPEITPDLDFRVYNTASPDQQSSEFFNVDDKFFLQNLHPDIAELEGALPGLKPRCFVDDANGFTEVHTGLETVLFLPEANLGVLIYRGQYKTSDRNAAMATDHLLIAYEHMTDKPRSLEEYEHTLRLRMDPATALAHMMNESQLSPRKTDLVLAREASEHAREVQRQQDDQDLAFQRFAENYSKETGEVLPDQPNPEPVDPAFVIAPEALARGDFDASPLMKQADLKLAEVQKLQAGSLSDIPDKRTSQASDEAIVEDAVTRARERKSSADAFNEIELPDDVKEEQKAELGRLEMSAKRSVMEPREGSKAASAAVALPLRRLMEALLASGESLTERDFTGADLSNIDFSGSDLSGSIFECANLTGAALVNCNLIDTSFVGASLSGCNFSNADLTGANMSACNGDNTSFNAAILSGAQFSRCVLRGSDLSKSQCAGINALEASILCADFSQATISNGCFMGADLTGGDFFECEINQTAFLNANLTLTRWREAKLSRSALFNTQMQLVSAEACSFINCQFAGETWITGSRFENTSFEECGLRGVIGTGVSFRGSRLIRCDLGLVEVRGSDLSGATLHDCAAEYSDFSGSDLSDSSFAATRLGSAKLVDCELKRANFYEADILLCDLTDSNYEDARNLMPLKEKRLDDERRRVA